jgi:arsenate reductase (thioredoxin)
MNNKPQVLVVCTGNSMRSQLAEGVLRQDLGEWIDVHSAGTHPSSVHPATIAALRDAGIDASQHYSKGIEQFIGKPLDLVITLCDNVHVLCPVFPNALRTIHRGYPDPIRIQPGMSVAEVFADLRDQMRVELREIVVTELNLPVKLDRQA